MPSVAEAVRIPAGTDAVWAVLVDLDRFPEWLAIHIDFPDGSPGQLQPDTTFRETVALAGTSGVVEWSTDEMAPNERLEISGDGPMGISVSSRWGLEGNSESTQLRMETEFSGAVLIGPMGKRVSTDAAKASRTSLDNFATLF
jgi:hypothetical protein